MANITNNKRKAEENNGLPNAQEEPKFKKQKVEVAKMDEKGREKSTRTIDQFNCRKKIENIGERIIEDTSPFSYIIQYNKDITNLIFDYANGNGAILTLARANKEFKKAIENFFVNIIQNYENLGNKVQPFNGVHDLLNYFNDNFKLNSLVNLYICACNFIPNHTQADAGYKTLSEYCSLVKDTFREQAKYLTHVQEEPIAMTVPTSIITIIPQIFWKRQMILLDPTTYAKKFILLELLTVYFSQLSMQQILTDAKDNKFTQKSELGYFKHDTFIKMFTIAKKYQSKEKYREIMQCLIRNIYIELKNKNNDQHIYLIQNLFSKELISNSDFDFDLYQQFYISALGDEEIKLSQKDLLLVLLMDMIEDKKTLNSKFYTPINTQLINILDKYYKRERDDSTAGSVVDETLYIIYKQMRKPAIRKDAFSPEEYGKIKKILVKIIQEDIHWDLIERATNDTIINTVQILRLIIGNSLSEIDQEDRSNFEYFMLWAKKQLIEKIEENRNNWKENHYYTFYECILQLMCPLIDHQIVTTKTGEFKTLIQTIISLAPIGREEYDTRFNSELIDILIKHNLITLSASTGNLLVKTINKHVSSNRFFLTTIDTIAQFKNVFNPNNRAVPYFRILDECKRDAICLLQNTSTKDSEKSDARELLIRLEHHDLVALTEDEKLLLNEDNTTNGLGIGEI